MAQMYPDIDEVGYVSSINKSEIDLYKILKNHPDTKNWTVFYSSRLKLTPVLNEIDFIILIPDEGVVLLELKANNPVEYNQFHFIYNYNGQNTSYENPFRKLKNLIPKFKTYLNLTEQEKNKLFVHYMLFFPNFFDDFDEKICFSKSNYINSRFSDIISTIIVKFNNAKIEAKNRIGASTSREEVNLILGKIKKEFLKTSHYIETSSITFEDSLKHSNRVLMSFYSLISNMRRVFIKGPSGCGKTYFALQTMITKNSEHTIAYICNSKMLFEKMRDSFKNTKNVGVSRYCDYSPLRKRKYDILILDEFEAFEGDISFFDSILDKGLHNGNLMVLFDPYKKNNSVDNFIKNYNLSDFIITINSNFRNNSAVLNFVNKLFDTTVYEFSFIEYYSNIFVRSFDNNNISNIFDEVISNIVEKERYSYNDIKIITSKKPHESLLWKVISRKRWSKVIDALWIGDFEGLDCKVVVLVVEETLFPIENILYVGATRAKQKLVILAKNNLYERIRSYV